MAFFISSLYRHLARLLISHRLRHHIRSFLVQTGGAAAVVVAVLFPVIVGGIGLGAETGYWYLTQRKLQHAADTAAHAAGTRLRAGDTRAQIEAVAIQVAAEAGFAASSLQVNTPPASGVDAGKSLSVEVLLTQSQPRLFSAVFEDTPVNLGARAVARVTKTGGVACVLALSPTDSGAVTVSGSTSVSLDGCDVASNSNASDSFLLSGSASAMTAGCVYTVGRASAANGLSLTQCEQVKQEAPVVRDPYASIAEPTPAGTCMNKNVGSPNSTTTLTPTENHPSGMKVMRFCGGLDAKGNVNFGPGLYIIEGGDFTVNSGNITSSSIASLTGSDVTFYFTNGGRLKLGANGNLNLSAPTSGPFSGLLFFGGRSESGITHQVNGAVGSSTDGAIYAPASHISFSGNSKTSGCLQVVAQLVTFTGNSALKSNCETAGTRDIPTNEAVALVE